MDQVIQVMRFLQGPSEEAAAARVLADLRSSQDPAPVFYEEVREKRAALHRTKARKGDMHRWCGKRRRVKLGDSWVTIYEEA